MRVLAVLKSIFLPIGLIVLGVLAVTVMNADDPKVATSTSRAAQPTEWTPINGLDLIEAAQSDFRANEANADSAPQQQVVAGWATKDLLGVVALQNAASMNGLAAINNNVIEMQNLQSNVVKAIQESVPPTDNRPRRLLTLIALAICWFGAWSVVPVGERGKQKDQSAKGEPSDHVESPAQTPTSAGGAPGASTVWNAPTESA